MKLNWNFLGVWGMQNKKTFCGGSMDIFWNCTISILPPLKVTGNSEGEGDL